MFILNGYTNSGRTLPIFKQKLGTEKDIENPARLSIKFDLLGQAALLENPS